MMNEQAHYAIMRLVIGWAIVAVFVFTAGVTCLSLIGRVTFTIKQQQRFLFKALIGELVVGCVAWFIGVIQLSPRKTVETIQEPLRKEQAQMEVRAAETVEEMKFVNLLLEFDKRGMPPINTKRGIMKDIIRLKEPSYEGGASLDEVRAAFHSADAATRTKMTTSLERLTRF